MIRDWTLDTFVLFRAAEVDGDAIELLNRIWREKHTITLDHEGHIAEEYKKCLDQSKAKRKGGSDLVSKWCREVVSKYAQFSSGKLQKKHQRALEKLKFDRSDWPFVGVCAKTTSKRLVAEDSDYSQDIKCYLQAEMSVEVLSIRDSLAL